MLGVLLTWGLVLLLIAVVLWIVSDLWAPGLIAEVAGTQEDPLPTAPPGQSSTVGRAVTLASRPGASVLVSASHYTICHATDDSVVVQRSLLTIEQDQYLRSRAGL